MLFMYYPSDSFLHRIDAVSKAIWLLVIAVVVLFAADQTQNFLVFSYVIFVGLMLGRLPFRVFLRRLIYVTWMALGILLIMSVTYPRGVVIIATVGPLNISMEGLSYGIAMAFRIMSLGSSSMVYALTTHPRNVVNDFVKFAKVPYRLAYALYAAFRFMPLLQTEARNILHAQAVRGFERQGKSPRAFFKSLYRLSVPLLVGGLRRVELTAIAMDGRAFGAYPTRTAIDDPVRPASGVVFAVVHLIALAGLITFTLLFGTNVEMTNPLEMMHGN